jgi:hypothetical protein
MRQPRPSAGKKIAPKKSPAKKKLSVVKKPSTALDDVEKEFMSPTDAKNQFFEICRDVWEKNKIVYVTDHTGEAYITITYKPVSVVTVDIHSSFFKTHFSRCSYLIRYAKFAFRILSRTGEKCIYVRRHNLYKDPLDSVIEQWREKFVDAAWRDSELAKLRHEFTDFVLQHKAERLEDQGEAQKRYKALVLGITRLSIGHYPFAEGQLPNDGFDPSARQAH